MPHPLKLAMPAPAKVTPAPGGGRLGWTQANSVQATPAAGTVKCGISALAVFGTEDVYQVRPGQCTTGPPGRRHLEFASVS